MHGSEFFLAGIQINAMDSNEKTDENDDKLLHEIFGQSASSLDSSDLPKDGRRTSRDRVQRRSPKLDNSDHNPNTDKPRNSRTPTTRSPPKRTTSHNKGGAESSQVHRDSKESSRAGRNHHSRHHHSGESNRGSRHVSRNHSGQSSRVSRTHSGQSSRNGRTSSGKSSRVDRTHSGSRRRETTHNEKRDSQEHHSDNNKVEPSRGRRSVSVTRSNTNESNTNESNKRDSHGHHSDSNTKESSRGRRSVSVTRSNTNQNDKRDSQGHKNDDNTRESSHVRRGVSVTRSNTNQNNKRDFQGDDIARESARGRRSVSVTRSGTNQKESSRGRRSVSATRRTTNRSESRESHEYQSDNNERESSRRSRSISVPRSSTKQKEIAEFNGHDSFPSGALGGGSNTNQKQIFEFNGHDSFPSEELGGGSDTNENPVFEFNGHDSFPTGALLGFSSTNQKQSPEFNGHDSFPPGSRRGGSNKNKKQSSEFKGHERSRGDRHHGASRRRRPQQSSDSIFEAKGRAESKANTVFTLLNSTNLDDETIAQASGITMEQLEAIKKQENKSVKSITEFLLAGSGKRRRGRSQTVSNRKEVPGEIRVSESHDDNNAATHRRTSLSSRNGNEPLFGRKSEKPNLLNDDDGEGQTSVVSLEDEVHSKDDEERRSGLHDSSSHRGYRSRRNRSRSQNRTYDKQLQGSLNRSLKKIDYEFSSDLLKEPVLATIQSMGGEEEVLDPTFVLKKQAENFQNIVEVKDRTYLLRTYKKCFIGSEAVDAMINNSLADTRDDAIMLGRKFCEELDLFAHVTGDHEFKDERLFYAFKSSDTAAESAAESDYDPRASFSSLHSSKEFTASIASVASDSTRGEKSNDVDTRRTIQSLLSKTSASLRGIETYGQGIFNLYDTDDKGFDEKAEKFFNIVELDDRRYLLTLYKNCFIGSEAVGAMIHHGLAKSRDEAVTLGNQFMEKKNLFSHVTGDHEFKDEHLFYHFSNTQQRISIRTTSTGASAYEELGSGEFDSNEF